MTNSPPNANPLQDDLDHILQHTRDLWEDVRGAAIFVTGGTGFFGRWLLESFAHAEARLGLNARMVVLSRDPAAFATKAPHLAQAGPIEFVRGDVRTLTAETVIAQLREPIRRYKFVIHAATEASAKLNDDDPLAMATTIVEGTRAALEFAAATGAERFLLTSSGAVYGPQPSHVTHLDEGYSGGPDCTTAASAYGEGKRLAELLCACYQEKRHLEPLIARCFAFVGPFLPLDAHFAIGNFIRDALGKKPISISGDGTPHRSYLYASDLAIWLWTILIRGKPMRPYNVGSEADFTIHQVADAVAAAIECGSAVRIQKGPTPGALPSRYVPLTARAREELGLQERVPLAEAIRRTARHASSTAV